MSIYRAFFSQYLISLAEREELLTTAIKTQENSDYSAAKVSNEQL